MPTPLAPSRPLATLALAVVAVLVAGLVAEGLLRFAYPIHAALFEPDPELLFRLRPGARKIHVEPGTSRRTTVSINRLGLRGPELGAADGPKRRIVVYGDSFVLAAFSPRQATFSERLGVHLGERTDQDIEVLNAGVAGYGPDQALLRMQREFDTLHPDAIVLTVFLGNDFGDPIRNKIYRLDADGKLAERPHALHPKMLADLHGGHRRLLLPRLARGVLDGLRPPSPPPPLAERLLEWRDLQTAELNDYFANDIAVRLFEDFYDAQLVLAPDAPPSRLKVALLSALLARARAATEARGIPLLVVGVPAALDVCAARGEAGRALRERLPSYDPDLLSEAFRAAAGSAGVEVVDLTADFLEAPGGACGLYFAGETAHWNDVGQELAARVVGERMAGELLTVP